MLRSSQCVLVKHDKGNRLLVEDESREEGKDMPQDSLKLGAELRNAKRTLSISWWRCQNLFGSFCAIRACRWESETVMRYIPALTCLIHIWSSQNLRDKYGKRRFIYTIRCSGSSKCTCLLESLCSINPKTQDEQLHERGPGVSLNSLEVTKIISCSTPHVSFEINCAPNFRKAQQSATLQARGSSRCFFFLWEAEKNWHIMGRSNKSVAFGQRSTVHRVTQPSAVQK